jgi:nitroimidazol reductase NimA-like FMN-containing flavoprotein (pyridoxamine 5'-phosphate oxidase superfamily)
MGTIPEAVEDLLVSEPPRPAHLATSHENRPHVAPLWFRYEDGIVEIVTTGRKLANIRANPFVSLSVEQSTDGDPEWMVTLQGKAAVVDDEEAFREANRKINRKYGAPEDAWEAENTLVRIHVGTASYKTF